MSSLYSFVSEQEAYRIQKSVSFLRVHMKQRVLIYSLILRPTS
jgi:hypothetical protein